MGFCQKLAKMAAETHFLASQNQTLDMASSSYGWRLTTAEQSAQAGRCRKYQMIPSDTELTLLDIVVLAIT